MIKQESDADIEPRKTKKTKDEVVELNSLDGNEAISGVRMPLVGSSEQPISVDATAEFETHDIKSGTNEITSDLTVAEKKGKRKLMLELELEMEELDVEQQRARLDFEEQRRMLELQKRRATIQKKMELEEYYKT
jgi:hypothetical protein